MTGGKVSDIFTLTTAGCDGKASFRPFFKPTEIPAFFFFFRLPSYVCHFKAYPERCKSTNGEIWIDSNKKMLLLALNK
jgi:hypothetical protein